MALCCDFESLRLIWARRLVLQNLVVGRLSSGGT